MFIRNKITGNCHQGFTMIEMLAVITITVILIATAIPGWLNFIQNNKSMGLSTELTNALRLARATAIKSGQNVILCPITNSTAACAAPSCLTSVTTWDAWIVFIDNNGDGKYDTTSTPADQLVMTYCDLPASVITSSNASVLFNPAGFASPTAGATFTIKPPGCTGNNGRMVSVMPSGNIRTVFTSCP